MIRYPIQTIQRQLVDIAAILLFFACILAGSGDVVAQSREDLERRKERLEEEIRMTSRLLEEARESAETGIRELVIINNRIERREELLSNIQQEIRIINRRISELTASVEELEEELERLKDAYAEMVRHAARTRDAYQRIMFIFSSSDFNQAYLRMRYLQEYSEHRRQQAERIQEKSNKLDEQIATLEEERERQQVLLANQREAVRELARERAAQEQTVALLQEKEEELQAELESQQKAARELDQAIRRVIAEERRKARERAEAEGRETTDMFALTPEEQALSENFADNRGNLPWPTERGVITSRFGEQPHPVLPGIKIANNGIDISTEEGAHARAIFDGSVSRVISIPGGLYAVIVRHGEYLSVYSNLSDVFVVNGQEIEAKDELGVVGTNEREAKTNLHLEIWKGNDKQNPASWIAGR
ncbi:MAG: peptidoglycan DD-metalloendopeptidase family protein [Bacteroidales bacterium]